VKYYNLPRKSQKYEKQGLQLIPGKSHRKKLELWRREEPKEKNGGKGGAIFFFDPSSSRLCTTFSIGLIFIFFNSRSLGIPRDLISRNHWGSGSPGSLGMSRDP
jgi:hypothetical protein